MSIRPVARPRLVSSLRWRLSTAITGLILLCTVACVASAVLFLGKELTDHANSDLQQSLGSVTTYMGNQRGELLGIASYVASDRIVQRAVHEEDRRSLILYLEPAYAHLNVDIIDVIDSQGRALVRMEHTSAPVVSVAGLPNVRQALRGQSEVALGPDSPRHISVASAYALRATVPLLSHGRIIGALVVGRDLDSVYASRVSRATNADINLIVRNQRTGTTLTDIHGLPNTGIPEPQEIVSRINRADTSIVRTQEDGQTVLSGLVPLPGANGRPAGAVEVVSRLDPLYGLITQLSYLLIAIGAVVVVLGTLLALGIARRLTRRLQVLEATASQVAQAANTDAPLEDLHPAVAVSGNDEVGSLARSVGAMMTALDQRMATNARLYEAAQARVRELTGLAEIARLLTAVPSVRETLDALGEKACALVGCSAVAIWVPGEGPMPALYGGHGLPEEYEGLMKAAIGDSSSEPSSNPPVTALAAMETGNVVSIRLDGGFEGLSANHTELRKAARRRGWLRATALPLKVQGQPVGALTCYSTTIEPISESELGLLTTIADQVAVAVENMRLYAESRDLAALEERARLARELHDSVTQALFSMTLHTRAAEMALAKEGIDPEGPVCRSISQLHELTQGALAEMRALIFELRPGALQEEGLVAAIHKHTAAVSAREGLEIDLKAPEERVQLDPTVEEHLYRLVQEAVHNVVKHAGASRVSIHLDVGPDSVYTLQITDDGVGFEPAEVPPGHLGLTTMAGRAQQTGGTLEIISKPGQGTTVRAVIPRVETPSELPRRRHAARRGAA